MDAVIRHIFLYGLIWCGTLLTGFTQQMNWMRLTEDTIYYGKDYLPDPRMSTYGGPGQIWDFRSVKAPYALSRRIIMSGERDGKTFANMVNGTQSDEIMLLTAKGTEVLQRIERNPVCPGNRITYTLTPSYKPFFTGVLGQTNTYKGKMVAVFAWPRDMNCVWSPPVLPDSCRITLTIAEDIAVDGEGTLYLPTEVAQVYRQKVEIKRAIRIETRTGMLWRDVTAQVPGIRLITTQYFHRFVASTSGLLLAEIELDHDDKPLRIEFKTHPLVTRVFSEEPAKPDIFAYPNPSYDVVRFQLSDLPNGKYTLSLFNILGVPVMNTSIDVNSDRETIALDLSDKQRGTYLFRLQDSRGRTIKTKRIVLIQS